MMASLNDTSPAGAGPFTSRVGADLRAARERLGYTLPAIASHLRIRLPFLEAIEDGRIADLPGNAYAVGFLRTYAQAVGLDPDEIARRFRAEAADVNRKTELTFPAPVPERGVPAGAVVLLGVVLVVGAYIGWYRMSGNDRSAAEPVQQVPERLAPLAQVAPGAPTPPPPAPTSAAAASIATGAPSPSAVPANNGAQAPAASPGSAAAASPPAASLLAANAPAPNVPMPPASLAAAVPVMAADGTRIVVRAKADAWVRVREKQGPILMDRTMHSGDTWPVPAGKTALLLTTGNAGATELVVDGVVSASLGGDGAVRRDLPLDPDMIRDGKLAPASATPGVPPATTTTAAKPAAPSSRSN